MSVVKTVASQLGLASPNQIKPSTLTRDVEVAWFMEIIGLLKYLFCVEYPVFYNAKNALCQGCY